jgi:hypothetical protein
MSTFDPKTFTSAVYTQRGDTEYSPCPEGEYTAQIVDVSARQINTKDGDERIVLDVKWEVLDESVKQATGRDKTFVRQSVFLDLTNSGHLDFSPGKNVQLSRLREACGQNEDGKPWSIRDLVGSMCQIMVEHRSGADTVFANVTRVARL